MKNRFFSSIAISTISLLLVFSLSSCLGSDLQKVELVYVIDGDSLLVTDPEAQPLIDGKIKTQQVRLIGLDAPEFKQEPWGKKSRDFLKSLVGEKGSKLYLEFDVDPKDKYDRSLAYVYNKEKDLVNELLLEKGYAMIFSIEPNTKYIAEFKEAEKEARDAMLNIWQQEDGMKLTPFEYRQQHNRRIRNKNKHIRSPGFVRGVPN